MIRITARRSNGRTRCKLTTRHKCSDGFPVHPCTVLLHLHNSEAIFGLRPFALFHQVKALCESSCKRTLLINVFDGY